MPPSLWLNNASSTPPELLIREGEQILGRSADADIVLDETFVSGYHARLHWNMTQLTVLDLDSTNGTLVNGVPVIGWTSLTDGDVIEFGGVEAVVRLPDNETDTVVDADNFPPPPTRTRNRQRPPVDNSQVDDDHVDDGQADDVDPPEGRTFGSQLGPMVSDQTEPLFDQPLTSAVTLPPTPPAGVSVTRAGRTTGDLQSINQTDFDFGNHHDEESGKQAAFGREGLKVTVGTAIAVFVALVVLAIIIIYVAQR